MVSILASSPGRFFANITAGEKYVFFARRTVILVKNQPGDEAISILVVAIEELDCSWFMSSLVPRPFPPPVFHRLQYANMEGEGLGDLVTCSYLR